MCSCEGGKTCRRCREDEARYEDGPLHQPEFHAQLGWLGFEHFVSQRLGIQEYRDRVDALVDDYRPRRDAD